MVLQRISDFVLKRPRLTALFSGFILSSSGDVCAQLIASKCKYEGDTVLETGGRDSSCDIATSAKFNTALKTNHEGINTLCENPHSSNSSSSSSSNSIVGTIPGYEAVGHSNHHKSNSNNNISVVVASSLKSLGLPHQVAQHLDFIRAAGMGTFSATCGVLFYVPYFKFLDRMFGSGRAVSTVLKKSFVDNFIVLPFLSLPAYFGWLTFVLKDKDMNGLNLTMYQDALVGSWSVWIPTSLAVFYVVPLHLRVPVSFIAEFFWATVVSYVSHPRVQ